MGIVNNFLNNVADAASEAAGKVYDDISTAIEGQVNKVLSQFPSLAKKKPKAVPILEKSKPANPTKYTDNTSLSKFSAAINTFSVGRRNLYSVGIQWPDGLKSSFVPEAKVPYPEAQRLSMLYCSAVNIPPLNIATASNRVFNAPFEVPYGITYEPVTMTFYSDQMGFLRELFEMWYNLIYDTKQHGFRFMNTFRSPEFRISTLYRNDNYTQMTHDANGNLINPGWEMTEGYSVILKNVYPKTISEISLGNSDTDIISFTVTFEYETLEFATKRSSDDIGFKNMIALQNNQSPNPYEFASNPNMILQPEANLPATSTDAKAIEAKVRSKPNFLTSIFIRGAN